MNGEQGKKALQDIAKKIDIVVAQVIDEEIDRFAQVSPKTKELVELMRPVIVEGGKRIRGAFVYFSYLMHGGTDLQEILKIATSIELTHAYALVHDDVMDQAPLRRGFTTIHEVYEKKYQSLSGRTSGDAEQKAKHFGNSIAITVGDILAHIALEVFVKSSFNSELKLKALQKFHRRLTYTGYGQAIDVFGEFEDVNEEYVMTLHLYKTGYYTYENPLHIGAVIAGANDEDLSVLTEYALPGGIAYQLQDDIIDTFSDDAKRIGKIPGTDIKEGKKTLLVVKAYENASDEQKKELDAALGNKNLTQEQLNNVRQIFEETGSLTYSKQKAKELLEKSTAAVVKSKKWENAGKQFLIDINEYMLYRKL